jgi:predicted helicase
MTTFNFVQFHEQLKDLEPHVKGRKFEEMLVKWISNHPQWRNKVENVYLREDDPKQLFAEDLGVDLVVYLQDGRIGVVQAKCYRENAVLTLNEDHLSNWFACSGHREVSFRILVSSAGNVHRHVTTMSHYDGKETHIYLYQDLVDAGVRWDMVDGELEITAREALELRDYQQECVGKALDTFKVVARKALITPFCATGKTLMFFKTWEAMHTEGMISKSHRPIVLFSAPLLALCDQHLKEHAIQAHCPHEYLAVASDHRLADGSQETLGQFDFGREATEDPKKIMEAMLKRTDVPLFIMACYDSVHKIAVAQSEGAPAVDLSCNDEVHTQMKCIVKNSTSSCLFLPDAEQPLLQSYQLNMTATPKCIVGPLRDLAEERNAVALTYQNEEYFGPHVFSFSAKKAREAKVNSPYKVYVAGRTAEQVYTTVNTNEIISGCGFDTVEARDLAAVASLLKLLKNLNGEKKGFGCSKNAMALVVGNTTENVSKYLHLLNQLNLRLPAEEQVENLHTLQITGKHTQRQRRYLLSHYERQGMTVVIGHCRTIGMGIDCPSIDVVAFMDPADEETRIIQNIGRALRMDRQDNPGKVSRVFIPVFCPEGETLEEMAAGGRFCVVTKVISNLCLHDADWITYVSQARIEGRKLRRQRQNFQPKFDVLECDIPISVDVMDFISQIVIEALDLELAAMFSMFEELLDWCRSMKRVPLESSDNEREAVHAQNLLALMQLAEDDELPDGLAKRAEEAFPEFYTPDGELAAA